MKFLLVLLSLGLGLAQTNTLKQVEEVTGRFERCKKDIRTPIKELENAIARPDASSSQIRDARSKLIKHLDVALGLQAEGLKPLEAALNSLTQAKNMSKITSLQKRLEWPEYEEYERLLTQSRAAYIGAAWRERQRK